MNIAEALRQAARDLAASSDTARLDAELLMAYALGVSRSDMLLRSAHKEGGVPANFTALIARRKAQEPVAYILGSQEFYGRDFRVTRDVLIPRADSETTLAAALEFGANAEQIFAFDRAPDSASNPLQNQAPNPVSSRVPNRVPASVSNSGFEAQKGPLRVLDCGTGSGALLISFLLERPQARGVGMDCSQAALAVAQDNARNLGLNSQQAHFCCKDWTQAGWADDLGRFDLIISNPPYVESGALLDPSVRDFEPSAALFAGPEGLDDYRLLIPQLRALMNAGAVAVLEIGYSQADHVSRIAAENGFATDLRRDLGQNPRALILR